MTYLVSLTERALSDLAYLYEWIGAETSEVAGQWYNGLEDAIFSLEQRPTRCPVTPESKKYRNLLYGHKPHIYRAIYHVLERQTEVVVLHILHGAMRPFKRAELG